MAVVPAVGLVRKTGYGAEDVGLGFGRDFGLVERRREGRFGVRSELLPSEAKGGRVDVVKVVILANKCVFSGVRWE